ncbi:MAG TPA: hypothetical protein VGJ28_12750 [Micromonosporaceae bacterium]
MQSPVARAHRHLLTRAITAGIGLIAPRLHLPPTDLPGLPPGWTPVAGSLTGDDSERFIGYVTERGIVVTVHSEASTASTPGGRLIALVTLGEHRVAIVEATEPTVHFEARWESRGRRHCVSAPATTLATFMPLVLNLDWS